MSHRHDLASQIDVRRFSSASSLSPLTGRRLRSNGWFHRGQLDSRLARRGAERQVDETTDRHPEAGAADAATLVGGPVKPELAAISELGRIAAADHEQHAAEEALRLAHQVVADAYPLSD